MSTAIINRGRGPEIAGTRITVYDIIYETGYGLSPQEIADLFELTVEEVQSAIAYIDANREEVQRNYEAIQARHARGNPPEVQAQIEATHAKYAPLWEELRQRAQTRQENADAGVRLPVLTLADAERIRHSREYAEQVAIRLMESILDVDHYRGVGRLYLP